MLKQLHMNMMNKAIGESDIEYSLTINNVQKRPQFIYLFFKYIFLGLVDFHLTYFRGCFKVKRI